MIRIKNAVRAQRNEVVMPSTKFIYSLAKALFEEGILQDVKVEEGILTARIAYSHKKPVMIDLRLVSKPGVRVYKEVDEIKARKSTSSLLVLTTPKGVMSSNKAVKENVGGEVIAEVW